MAGKKSHGAARVPNPQVGDSAQLPFQIFTEAVRYQQLGKSMQAEALYRAVLALQPGHIGAWYNLGLLLQLQGKLDNAIAMYREALRLQPNDTLVLCNLGAALKDLGRNDEAIATYRQALQADPRNVMCLANLGVALKDAGAHDEAIDTFQTALRIKPDDVAQLSNLGAALFDKGDIDAALETYARALAIQPGFALAHLNSATALRARGRVDEAVGALHKAIAAKPDFPEAHYTLGQILLMEGRYEEGWKEYGWRWKLPQFAWLSQLHGHIPQPLWSGEPLQGRILLVYAEQGLGDTIQFLRYVPMLVQTGARVVLALHGALRQLVAPVEGVRVIDLADPLPAFDVRCPLLDLPRLLGAAHGEIVAPMPYLAPQAAAVDVWRQRFASRPGPSVGLVWSGDSRHPNDRQRSMSLELLRPLLDIPGINFYGLQKQPRPADELALATLERKIVSLSSLLTDMGETAAAIAALDLVITVDTAVAHLAGALGRPVWIMLPFMADWRWMRGREDSPWYPTARLFRQGVPGDWQPIVSQLGRELSACIAKPAR